MSEKLLSVDVVSPQKTVYSDQRVSYVSAPGALGRLGILPGHMPLISILLPGELKISEKEGRDVRVDIGSGFIQIKDDRVLILAEEAREIEG